LTKENTEDKAFKWGKLLVPLIMTLLVGSEGWQYYAAPEKIKTESETHVNTAVDKRIDSLIQVIGNAQFSKGVFNEGAKMYKGFDDKEAEVYLSKVFKLADEGLKNDSAWRYVQKPFILWLLKNKKALEFNIKYKVLGPMQDTETGKLEFNYIDGLHKITEHNGVKQWRDASDDKHLLQSISNITDVN